MFTHLPKPRSGAKDGDHSAVGHNLNLALDQKVHLSTSLTLLSKTQAKVSETNAPNNSQFLPTNESGA